MRYTSLLLFACLSVFAQQSKNVELVAYSETASGPYQGNPLQDVSAGKDSKIIKPVKHQDNDRLYMSNTGIQYAFLVNPQDSYNYLQAITLPLMKAAFEAEGRPGVFDKIDFYTLVKVELLENYDGKPGNKIGGFEQNAVVTNVKDAKECTINLPNAVQLPAKGAFVQLTIIGRCDVDGTVNVSGTHPYKDTDGTEKVWMDYCQPNFPLTARPKGPVTYVKNTNYNKSEWQTINQPALHRLDYNYPDFNIGFGYILSAK